MKNNSLYEFADRILEIMRSFAHGIDKKNNNDLCKGTITFPQFIILDLLFRKNNSKMTDIAKLMNITTAAVTGMIDRLEKLLYVERIHDIKDRRIINIKLTKKGFKIVSNIHSQRRNTIISMFEKISEPERKEYLRILTKVQNTMLEKNL